MKSVLGICVFVCCSFIFTFKIRGQVNFVINGDFEDTITCSSHITYQLFPYGWWMYNTVDNYRAPFVFCANSGTAGTFPFNAGGFQYPHSGSSYVGVVTILSSSTMQYYREYIQTQLTDTLEGGKTYCVSFWYNEANRTKYSIDQLGIYLSLNGINLSNTSAFTQYNPQITTPSGQYLNDTLNWNQFKTSFTAFGNEVYFTLGNFYDSVQTNTILYPNHFSPAAESYYLIDDISIIPIDLPAWAGLDTSMCEGDSVYIGRPYEVGLDNIWTELTTGTPVDTGAGFWLHADSSATYVVTQDLCGTITTDTIRVIVNCSSIENFIKASGIKVFPSPANDVITVEGKLPEAEVLISDVLGKVVARQKLSNRTQIQVNTIPDGVYMVNIRSESGSFFRKIVIQH